MSESANIDKLLNQAESLSDGDLSTFCEDLVNSINSSSAGECSSSLRQLFIVAHASKKRRRLSPSLMDALVNILVTPDRSRMFLKVTASLLLTELAPSPLINFPEGNMLWNDAQIPFILPVLMSMGYDKEQLSAIAPQVIRWLSTVGFSVEVKTRALSAAAALIQQRPDVLTKDHQYVVDCQIGEWLKSASLYQAMNRFSRGIFKRDDQTPITELDGQATRNFFTVLCVCQYYTDDQLLNIHSFSLLQHWLYHTRGVCPYGPTDTIDADLDDPPDPPQSRSRSDRVQIHRDVNSQGQAEVRRSRDPSPTPSVVPYPFEDSSMQYAIRIIEQFDKKPKAQLDIEVQQACVMEAVGILNQLCQCDRSVIVRTFEVIKRLSAKLSPNTHQRVMVCIMQFYLNHSEAVMFDMFPLFELYLGQVVSVSHANSAIAFDTIMFLQDNKDALIQRTQLLTAYFPNIFKILAWNPRCYVTEFAELLPAFLSPTTAIEMFHSLLDLPLLSAALEISKRSESMTADSQAGQSISPHLIEKLREARYKPMLKFILRREAGRGDTIDRLDTLHNLLTDLTNHQRVVACADTVPVLLRIYFDVVLSEGSPELVSTLVPVILERARLLYRIAGYQQAVHSVFAGQLVAMFGIHPRLVMDQFTDLVDFVGGIRNISHGEDLFVHVVWVVGEYLNSWHDVRCTPDRIAAMFDALEAVAYEVSGRKTTTSAPPTGKTSEQYSARLLTTLMSALAKLASRSQDLIPRVILCLTKLGTPGATDGTRHQAVSDRASELVSLLQVPNIAAMVLSPHPDRESGRWHTDNTSLPAVLRATSRILQSSPSSAQTA